MISVSFQGKPFSITVIQVYAPTINAEEAEVEHFNEDLQDLLELTPKKRPFHHRGLECKTRKSRNTWSNGQIWPWSTEWSRAKANRILPGELTGHGKHTLPTTQEKTLQWTSPDGQYWNQIGYILCSKQGEALYSQRKQDWELTVAPILNSLLPKSISHFHSIIIGIDLCHTWMVYWVSLLSSF